MYNDNKIKLCIKRIAKILNNDKQAMRKMFRECDKQTARTNTYTPTLYIVLHLNDVGLNCLERS